MKVYVINKHGEPLMPCSPRKARVLLKEGKAEVVRREPFTIQLNYGSSGYKQDITVGVDTGHKNVGVSVKTDSEELNSYDFELRNDISKKMSERRMYRRNRRSRKRYREPRFDNRGNSKREGSLAPSVQWKVDAHKRIIDLICNRLPKSTLILETGKFDTQKLANPDIKNEQYQKGVQYDFANVREYVLTRDGHKCQSGKSGCSKKLHVHHIKFRSNGGSDKPSNLITLCEKHHNQLHEGKWKLNKIPKKGYKAATTMGVIRKILLEHYPKAIETFGYVTKKNRFNLELEKSHTNDAFVIAGGTTEKRAESQQWKFKRKNNRKLQKSRRRFGISIRRQRYSLQPKDIVVFENRKYEVKGVHGWGRYCKISNLEGVVSKPVKDLEIVFRKKSLYHINNN